MKLLLIGHNYSPEPTGIGVVTAEFAQKMRDRGHRVTVATTFPHYPSWRWQWGRRLRSVEMDQGVLVRRLWTPLPRRRSAVWRVLFHLGFALTGLLNAASGPRPDVIVVICPPVELAFTTALLSRWWRVSWCIWVKDLPLDAAIETGLMAGGGLTHRLATNFESVAFGLCPKIVVLHERFGEAISRKGVAADKIVTIPNWIDKASPAPRSDDYRSRLGAVDGEFLLLHAGNMGAKQALNNVVETAGLLEADSRFRVALIGDGPSRDGLIAAIDRLGLTRVRVLPLQPAAEIPRYFAAADALLINQARSVVDSVVPMKLLSYMAAAKPIVAAVHESSVTAQIVREAGCGLVVAPEDPEALVAGIRKLADLPDRDRLASNGRRYYEERFSTDKVFGLWESLLSELCHLAPSARTAAPVARHG